MDREKIYLYLGEYGGFLGVAACLDCIHIPVASPVGEDAEVFRNRK